jgi:predicted nucleotidyltransferase
VPSVIRERSFGSVRVFWLDSGEALERLGRAASRLVAERPEVARVVLFGSLAEGRAVPGSDADVLILLDRSERARWIDRLLDYQPFFEDVELPVEVFCYTREEAERVPLAPHALSRGLPGSPRVAESPPGRPEPLTRSPSGG